MSSPGIDRWIEVAPKSWAKLAKGARKNTNFENFKKKFFEGAEKENKGYLKKYLNEDQLKHIFEKGAGGVVESNKPVPKPKPTKLVVKRFGKEYTRSVSPRWGLESKFVLFLAVKEKPRSAKYKELVEVLVKQGRSRQAVIKKIQRERKAMK